MKDGLQRSCRTCRKGIRKAWYARHGQSHKETVRRQQRKISQQLNQTVVDYLSIHPCVDCQEEDIVVLEFDHVRGKKIDAISAMVAQRVSIKTLQAEMAKCEIRCANCHRRKTAKQFGHHRFRLCSSAV